MTPNLWRGHPVRVAAGAGFVLSLARPALAQDVPDVQRLVEFIRWGGVVASIPLLLGALFLIGLVDRAAAKLSARFTNRRPTIQKIQTTTRFGVYILVVTLSIGLSIRLDATALAVIGGALAFAIGFALRDLVASFIAGVTIIFDRPFQVGDRVSYGGEYGDIVKIGLRSVRMNTLDHNIITIPNNKVFTDVTSSGNYGALEMQVAMTFYIGIDQDAELAATVVREACLTSPYVHLAEPIPVTIKQVILHDYMAVELKARPYVFDCKYEKPFESDVHFRVLAAFRKHAVQPPAVLHRQLADEPASTERPRRSEPVPASGRARTG
jgi:small-conductance mechanosensitive channel